MSDVAGVPRRVWRGTGLQIGGRIFGSLCTLATLALLARHLPTSEFGRYTFYLALFGVLDALTDFGTGQVAVQRTADDPWALSGVLSVTRRIRFAMASLGVASVTTLAWATGEPGWFWIGLATLYELTHTLELSAVVFKNRIAWGIPVAIRAFAAASRLTFVVLLTRTEVSDAAPFVFATALGSSIANVLLHRVSRRHLPRSAMPVRAPTGIFRAALPLGLAGLCQQLYFYVDNVFVRVVSGEEELGHYNAAVRLLSFGILCVQNATVTALPWLVRESSAGTLARASARLAQPLVGAAAFFGGLAWPLGGAVLELLYGEGFEAALPSLHWLILAAIAIHAGAVLVTAVVASGGTRSVLAVTATGLVVNLIGNALLVPRIGAAGAALATFLTELCVVVASIAILMHRGSFPLRVRPLLWLVPVPAFFAGKALGELFV